MNSAGNIIIEEVVSEFTKIHNKLIENKNIDVLTLGVYTKIMRLGKSWELNIKGLAMTLGLSDTKVRACMKSLEIEGFLVRTKVRNDNGTISGYNYIFKSIPAAKNERSEIYATNANMAIQKPNSGETILRENHTMEKEESLYKELNKEEDLNKEEELNKQQNEKTDEWRHNYTVYRMLVDSGVNMLLSDSEYKSKYEDWFVNVDYEKTVEKTAYWWLSDIGWDFCKKKRKTNNLNFYSTLKNNLDKNRVYKYSETKKIEAVIAKTDEKLDLWRKMKQ